MILKFSDVAKEALPITLREFRKSLISLWDLHPTWQKAPTTLGLAISGGVDSMALASLCAKMQDNNWKFRAFVVDHGARIGSEKEAYEVAELVKKQGIDTTVLRIKWPKDIMPSQSSKFESLARKHRYRILGEACRDSGIRSLLLAHHENDQYETLMMRLANGHKGQGLLGMKASGRIPECDGIYGVHCSDASDEEFSNEPHSSLGISKDLGKSMSSDERRRRQHQRKAQKIPFLQPMRAEQGSIRILRPFLLYSKDRLIATCRQDRTSWFEDSTNADPTFTLRNALRHIFKKHTLPAALQKNSILALSNRLRQKDDLLEGEALSLLDQHSIWSFEPRAGLLSIRFPKLTSFKSSAAGEKDKVAADYFRRDIARRTLRYAIKAVSPMDGVRFQLLDQVSSYVYPELNQTKGGGEKHPDRFTIAGVMFQREERSNVNLAVSREAVSDFKRGEISQDCINTADVQDCGWLISRQPHESFPERQPILEYSPLTIFADKYSGWKYYDGRYWIWIRVQDQSFNYIRVRPFREEDLRAFNKLDFKARQLMLHRLKTIAPGPIRFTLPVIVRPKSESGVEEMILALPTLDISIPGAEKFMEYKIRFKEVLWPRPQQIEKIPDDPAPPWPKVNSRPARYD